jgi:hypothetical protein
MLGLFYVFVIYYLLRGPVAWFEKTCECKINKLDISHIEVDEDIPVYQQCLDDDDRSWTI